ncbi:MAG TPA: ATP-binding cassette domain-containing protein, partial [Dehalococcoidia bacterium]|nr:ATP-binding cassette domain-containing protein [Dehalococcoidia bacterium]
MAKDVVISATNVHKTYDTGRVKVHALRGIDLEVQRGEILAIIGPSGCGKTTLLNCLSGLDKTDFGEIWVEGVNLQSLSDRERT